MSMAQQDLPEYFTLKPLLLLFIPKNTAFSIVSYASSICLLWLRVEAILDHPIFATSLMPTLGETNPSWNILIFIILEETEVYEQQANSVLCNLEDNGTPLLHILFPDIVWKVSFLENFRNVFFVFCFLHFPLLSLRSCFLFLFLQLIILYFISLRKKKISSRFPHILVPLKLKSFLSSASISLFFPPFIMRKNPNFHQCSPFPLLLTSQLSTSLSKTFIPDLQFCFLCKTLLFGSLHVHHAYLLFRDWDSTFPFRCHPCFY